jgi:streptomycin 6-kinase
MEEFVRNTLQRGEAGRQWLDDLPKIVEELQARWRLTLDSSFSLSYNYVVPVVRHDGRRAVLKLVFPAGQEYVTELEALRLYGGAGAVRVLAADESYKAMLLERVEPGTPVSTLEDDTQATSILAATMRQLWQAVPADHPFPSIADWVQSIQRYKQSFPNQSGPLPSSIVDKAERFFDELIDSTQHPVVCHGDLHHYNVLWSPRGWLAIDPKGVIADPAYETAVLLHNPDIDVTKSILERRIHQLADELGIELERIRRWGFAHAILSAIWCIEDGGDCWQGALEVAERIDAIRG